MNTLLIDTHADFIFLAIYQNQEIKYKKESKEKKDHSTICMPLLIELLSESKLNINQIDDIIVVNGPGSFTGVRIGVTIAKIIAYTMNIPIRTITSLELYLNELTKDYQYIALEEKNGFYVGNLINNQIKNYEYIKRNEWEKWNKNKKIFLCQNINYNNICSFAKQKKPINPHLVNPFYVKKIEAEK